MDLIVEQRIACIGKAGRHLHWGAHFKRTCAYVLQNELEGLSQIPYKKRGRQKVPSG